MRFVGVTISCAAIFDSAMAGQNKMAADFMREKLTAKAQRILVVG